jgi:hypothetical protein
VVGGRKGGAHEHMPPLPTPTPPLLQPVLSSPPHPLHSPLGRDRVGLQK